MVNIRLQVRFWRWFLSRDKWHREQSGLERTTVALFGLALLLLLLLPQRHCLVHFVKEEEAAVFLYSHPCI